MKRVSMLLKGLLALLAVPVPAVAQGVAVGGGIGLPLHVTEIAPWESSFVPVFLNGLQGTGRGTQAITLDRGTRPSFWGSLEWFPGAHAGVLLRGSFQRAPLDGMNAPYSVNMDYVSRQPPDYIERQFHYQRSTNWPPTTGYMETWAFDVQASFATTAEERWRAHVDAGISLVNTTTSFAPIGLTSFQLGGHSVLFPNEYEVTLGTGHTWAAAGVASGGIAIPLGTHAGIELAARTVLPRTLTAGLHVRQVDGDVGVAPLTSGEAERALAPAPLELKLGRFEVLVGVRMAI